MPPCTPAARRLLPFLFAVLAAASGNAAAQPANAVPAAPDIAERGSRHYDIERLPVQAGPAGHGYQIHLLRPRRPAPPEGYPVIYFLDGNAVLHDLDDGVLGRLVAENPPVIVTLGYETAQRFALEERAYDYTPPVSGSGETDPGTPQRRNGGADLFMRFLEDSVKPAVAQRLPIDSGHQGIWGHSYGGLFVLHVLLSQPESFRCYVAASPSLWWRNGYLLTRESADAEKPVGRSIGLLVTRGGAERRRTPEARQAMAHLPPNAAADFAERMRRFPGMQVEYREFPGLNHGPALTASLEPALQWFETCKTEIPALPSPKSEKEPSHAEAMP